MRSIWKYTGIKSLRILSQFLAIQSKTPIPLSPKLLHVTVPHRHLRVGIFTPPVGHPPVSPHPAPAYLHSYISEFAGKYISVVKKDLGSIAYNYLLAPRNLAASGIQDISYQRQVSKALHAMRSQSTYNDFTKFYKAKSVLEDALRTISKLHHSESLILSGNTFTYYSKFSYKTRDGLLQAARNEHLHESFFYRFFDEQVIPYVDNQKLDVVGITVFQQDQLIPALVLSRLIKRAFPKIVIVHGGNYYTRLSDILTKNDSLNRELFEIIDFMILYEGEFPFARLLDCLRVNDVEGISQINKLIYMKDDELHANFHPAEFEIVDLATLSTPDYTGLFTDLDDATPVHWAPTPVITYQATRGCHYAKLCNFCSNPLATDNTWRLSAITNPDSEGTNKAPIARQKPVESVVDDIECLSSQFRTISFSFADESLTPIFLRQFSQALINRDLHLVWDCYARIDSFISKGVVNRELIQLISRAGCHFIQFGLETVDPTTQQAMEKGSYTDLQSADVLRATTEAGIMNHVFVFVGYPNVFADPLPTYLARNLRTLKFLIENRTSVVTEKTTSLMLPRDASLMQMLDTTYRGQIELLDKWELLINRPYRKKDGMEQLDQTIVDVYDFWIRNYHGTNPVSRTYIYQQRLFLTLSQVQSFAMNYRSSHGPTDPQQIAKEQELLKRAWKKFVGHKYSQLVRSFEELSVRIEKVANRQHADRLIEFRRQVQGEIDDAAAHNPVIRDYPHGFRQFEDLLACIHQLIEASDLTAPTNASCQSSEFPIIDIPLTVGGQFLEEHENKGP